MVERRRSRCYWRAAHPVVPPWLTLVERDLLDFLGSLPEAEIGADRCSRYADNQRQERRVDLDVGHEIAQATWGQCAASTSRNRAGALWA